MKSRCFSLLIGGAAFGAFAWYFALVGLNWSAFADILLAVGAGLITGLTIYAITNHRSKEEMELIKIGDYSRKALNNYFTLYTSISKYKFLWDGDYDCYSDYEADSGELVSTINKCWSGFVENSQSLLHVEYNTFSELTKVKEIYADASFYKNTSTTIDNIIHPRYKDTCLPFIIQFENETFELWKNLVNLNTKAEDELKKLRSSLI